MAADTDGEFGNDEARVRLIDRLFGDPETSPERPAQRAGCDVRG
jgi:hypothetical protein